MSIKDLKKLQLRFIISDFFARKLSENNHNIEMLLKFGKPDGIYNTIISDRKTLKYILEDFSKNLDNNILFRRIILWITRKRKNY